MKRGCTVRIWDDERAKEALQESVGDLCRRLLDEVSRHDELPYLHTLKIECHRDIDPLMIRIDGTIESSPRMLEYQEIIQMYLDARYQEEKENEGD